jgi:hypothetical protein
MRGVNLFIGVIIGLLTGLPVHALTWEQTALDLAIEAGTSEVVARFPFKNESARTVVIRELKSSCGCSKPTVETQTIPAGGEGVVSVAYAPGNRTGPQSARLTVVTDEPEGASTDLLLKIDIQPVLSFAPRLVQWSRSEEAFARIIEIKRLSASPVRIVEVKPTGEALTVELKAGANTNSWQLVLTPKSVAQPSTTKVEIHAEVGERKVTYSVFGVVR